MYVDPLAKRNALPRRHNADLQPVDILKTSVRNSQARSENRGLNLLSGKDLTACSLHVANA